MLRRESRVLEVQLAVTKRCCLECKYCFVKQSQEDMSPDLALTILRDVVPRLRGFRNFSVEILGGEPLLNWECTKFIILNEAFRNKKAKVSTNGVLLEEEMVEDLRRAQVSLSFDGIQDVEQRVGRGFDTFSRVMEKSQLISSVAKTCHAMITPSSIDHLTENFVLIRDRLKLVPMFTLLEEPVWRTEDVERLRSSLGALREEVTRRFRSGNEMRIPGPFCGVLSSLNGRSGCSLDEIIAFSPDGSMHPCFRAMMENRSTEETRKSKEIVDRLCSSCTISSICKAPCCVRTASMEEDQFKTICSMKKTIFQETDELVKSLRGTPPFEFAVQTIVGSIR